MRRTIPALAGQHTHRSSAPRPVGRGRRRHRGRRRRHRRRWSVRGRRLRGERHAVRLIAYHLLLAFPSSISTENVSGTYKRVNRSPRGRDAGISHAHRPLTCDTPRPVRVWYSQPPSDVNPVRNGAPGGTVRTPNMRPGDASSAPLTSRGPATQSDVTSAPACRTETAPVSPSMRTDRPLVPPTSSSTTGTPRSESDAWTASTFRVPIRPSPPENSNM